MKKITVLITLFITCFSNLYASDFEITTDPFTTVYITGNFKVTMIESDVEKIQVSNNDPDYQDAQIIASVSGGTLDIKIKKDNFKERKIEMTIYYKKVFEIEARKGCKITLNNVLKGDVLTLSCKMGGQIKGEIDAVTAKMKISNDGLILITGKAEMAELEVSTGGTLEVLGMTAESVSAKVTAGGSIKCVSNKKLSIKITSGGSVSYRGNPADYDESISLGGSITKLTDK